MLRHSVQILTESNCALKSEVECTEHVCQQLVRKVRDLRQSMLLQHEMLAHKEFVTCKLTMVATENFELKVQNQKLWTVIER